MKKKIFVSCCFFLGWAHLGLFAQQGIVATGGDATGSGGTVSYSVGQIDYNNTVGSNGNTMEGLQQPYEIFVTTVETNDIELSSTAFPNPSMGTVSLTIENFDDYEELSYELHDELGRVVQSKRIEKSETIIGLEGYNTAKYYLVVRDKTKNLKTYKIIKQF